MESIILRPLRVAPDRRPVVGPRPANPGVHAGVTTSTGNIANEAQLKEFLIEGALFNPLGFTPGSTLNPDDGIFTLLPAGDITGVGFYMHIPRNVGDNVNRTIRLDQLEIFGVPEPGRALLLVAAALAMTCRRRGR